MRRIFRPFVILFSAALLTASCLSDDDTTGVTYYSDTAITSFSLGTLNRTMWTKTSDGLRDSSYVDELDASSFDFYIDQAACKIYNPDSLPVGTDAAHVLCNAGGKNGGVVTVVYKDQAGNDSIRALLSTDSIDFTEPRTFRVFSNDGAYRRDYEVRVNVHRESPDSMTWSNTGRYAPFTELEAMKAVTMGGGVYLFGRDGSQTVVYGRGDNGGWAELARVADGDAYATAVVRGDSLYMAGGGQLMRSADGREWMSYAVSGAVQPVRLVAAGSRKLYGVDAGGRMVSAAESGYGWTVDGQPADMSGLPVDNVTYGCFALKTDASAERIVIVGNRDVTEDTVAMTWNKIEEYSEGSQTHSWTPCNEPNAYRLPRMRSLAAAAYGDVIIAMGGSGIGHTAVEPYSQFYVSGDNGLTWRKYDEYYLPDGFTNGGSDVSAMAVDDDNFIWIICGGTGDVWRGRLNRLGWAGGQTSFTE